MKLPVPLMSVNEEQQSRQHPEPRWSPGCSVSGGLRVLASSGVVVRLQVVRVSLKVHRQTLVVQNLAGQDQVFGFVLDAPDAAGSLLAPDGGEGEGLPADAQVVLEHLPSAAGAHGLDPAQILWMQEGLRGPVAAAVVLDVGPPLVHVVAGRRLRADVAPDEGVEAVVPPGALARGVVFGRRLVVEQEEDGEENPESSHRPAFGSRRSEVRS